MDYRGRMFGYFDHPLIDDAEIRYAELRAERLRAQLAREHSPPSDDAVLQRLELPLIEPTPDIAREPIKVPAIHAAHEPAPALNDHGRR